MIKLWTIRVLKFVVLIALIAGAAPAARAVLLISSCDQTITEDAKLAQNITCAGTNGVEVDANGVTLDLAGFSITGDATHEGVRVSNNDDVTVQNGTITTFADGVHAFNSDGLTLKSLRITNSTVGVIVQNGSAIVVDRSFIVLNIGDGLRLEALSGSDSDTVTVTGSNVSRNGSDGIQLEDTHDSVFTKNRIVGNTGSGINFDSDNPNPESRSALRDAISGNTISANTDAGVRLGATAVQTKVTGNVICGNESGVLVASSAASNNVVEKNKDICGNALGVSVVNGSNTRIAGNKIRSSVDGILVAALPTGTVIEGNTSSFNADDGIDVNTTSATITKNAALSNGGFGIEAVNGVTDGGGNKASDNVAGQCPVVVCA